MSASVRPWLLLVSARDPGAASGIAEVVEAARTDPRFDIRVAAADPAAASLGERGIEVQRLGGGGVPAQLDGLRAEAGDLLERLRPDALLVGLSGPDVGIDEVLLELSGDVPTYALQDYWGDVNDGLGVAAGTYFVMDEHAARLTRARAAVKTSVVGSVKHARLAETDVAATRRQARHRLGADDQEVVVVFYGQPLWDDHGYAATLSAVGEVRSDEWTLLYRPHPKEDRQALTERLPQVWGPADGWRLDPSPDPVSSLCAADLALSAYSTCLVDLLFLLRIAPEPIAVPVFVLFDEALVSRYRAHARLDGVPPAEAGLALLVRDVADLPAVVERGLAAPTRADVWRRARSVIPDPELAPLRLLGQIADDLEAGQ